MFPVIVPMLINSQPEKPPRCRHCGKSWPIANDPWTRKDSLEVAGCLIAAILVIAFGGMFICWTVDRDYGPHQGEHFIPYVIDIVKWIWQMMKELV